MKFKYITTPEKARVEVDGTSRDRDWETISAPLSSRLLA